jgi:2-oxoglutarate ferredoxin oxidoreductase subunit alpha
MTAEDLDAGKTFGRYLDVDGDGIPFRTWPGTHATKGSFFTRGTSRDRYARYTEEGPAYVDNMQRLLKKFDTARSIVPHPIETRAAQPTRDGVLYFGSTSAAMREALEVLAADGIHLDAMRLRAFPFHDDVSDFIARHDRVFLVEQNRDAQMKSLIVNECGVDPAKVVAVLHYDGTPITANFIKSAIADRATAANVVPLRKA